MADASPPLRRLVEVLPADLATPTTASGRGAAGRPGAARRDAGQQRRLRHRPASSTRRWRTSRRARRHGPRRVRLTRAALAGMVGRGPGASSTCRRSPAGCHRDVRRSEGLGDGVHPGHRRDRRGTGVRAGLPSARASRTPSSTSAAARHDLDAGLAVARRRGGGRAGLRDLARGRRVSVPQAPPTRRWPSIAQVVPGRVIGRVYAARRAARG